MNLIVEKSTLSGTVAIPGSKSHTIRSIFFASLAEGNSTIRKPLDSFDTQAAVQACRAFGADIEITTPDCWTIKGVRGRPKSPDNVIDVANSGTTLYIALATATLVRDGWTILTGDAQIRRRPARPLIDSLRELGAEIFATRGNAMCPLVVRGPLTGGATAIDAVTSQWVTAILMNAPLAEGDTELNVENLNEAPYVGITLDWLTYLGASIYGNSSFSNFKIPGRQQYLAFDRAVPADFSSATFFLVAGAALGGEIRLQGLDIKDSQGDKAVVDYLRKMGAAIEIDPSTGDIIVTGKGGLQGADLDLNATPDALPAMAVAGALATGVTRLLNVPQARVKETDRIAVMAAELRKMGVTIEETPDGLIIEGRSGILNGSPDLNGHDDHRVVMALSLAAMASSTPSRISTAEAIGVTFPTFIPLMQQLGASLAITK